MSGRITWAAMTGIMANKMTVGGRDMKPIEVIEWLLGFAMWVVIGGTMTAIGGIAGIWAS